MRKYSKKSETELEKKISSEAGLKAEEVIVDLPLTPKDRNFNIRVKKSGSVRPLAELTPIPEALRDAEWQLVNLGVYAPEEKREKVRSVAEKLLKT